MFVVSRCLGGLVGWQAGGLAGWQAGGWLPGRPILPSSVNEWHKSVINGSLLLTALIGELLAFSS